MFATLTAPSFGAVHHRVVDPDGKVQRCHPGAGCNQRHAADDPCLGQAVDPDTYDYHGAVIWNALAGVLWHRTTTLIVRHLARQLGLTEGEFRRQARLSYGKVAEFQARGLVHFHVIVRLDGPDGPHQPPPEGLTVETLTAAIEAAARQAVVTSPDSPATGGPRQVRWGEQLDIQPITAADAGDGELTDQKVAGYVWRSMRPRRPRTPAPSTGPWCAGAAKAPATTPTAAACAKPVTAGPPATTTSTTWSIIRTPRP